MSAFGKCGGGGRRCAARQSGPLTAIISTVTETRSAVLLDISSTGARLEGRDLPGVSEELSISIEGVRAFGSVRWTDGDVVGLAFDDPLDCGAVELLREKVAKGAGYLPAVKAALDDWETGFAR